MAIQIRLDVMLARRKMKSRDLARLIGITDQNLSILKTGKARALRLSTLDAICRHLQCQPGDLLEFDPGGSEASAPLEAGAIGAGGEKRREEYDDADRAGAAVVYDDQQKL